MTGTAWTAFVGVTGLVLTLFLALARLSQGLVRGGAGDHDGALSTAPDAPATTDSAPADPAPSEGPFSVSGPRCPDRDDDSSSTADGTVPPETGNAIGNERNRNTDGNADGKDTTDRRDDPPIPATSPPTGTERTDRPEGRTLELSPGVLLVNVALTQGVFGGIVAAAAVVFAIPPAALGLSGAPLSTGLPAVGVGVVFGAVLWVGNELASVLADSAGVAYDERLREMLAPDSAGGWAVLLGAVLPLVAGVEELLFRAAAIGVPSAAYGVSPWAMAVVSSLAFALGHGAQGRTGMVVTGVLGFALAAGFILTDSLLVVVVAHYLVNALEFLVHEGLGVERLFGRGGRRSV